MDPISQLDCMLTKGAISQEQRDSLVPIIAGFTGMSQSDMLLLLLAGNLSGTFVGASSSLLRYVSVDSLTINQSKILADTTSGPLTITLPLNPNVDDRVDIYDAQSTFGANNLTVNRNGQLINSAADNLVLNVSSTHVKLIFVGGATGWAVFAY